MQLQDRLRKDARSLHIRAGQRHRAEGPCADDALHQQRLIIGGDDAYGAFSVEIAQERRSIPLVAVRLEDLQHGGQAAVAHRHEPTCGGL